MKVFKAAPEKGKARRFKSFYDAAQSCSRVEQIIARVEVGADGADTRFIVTNRQGGNARTLYEDVHCRRGQAENHIKLWKTHPAADRTSCTKATANLLWLFLPASAYRVMWGLRVSMPKRSMWRVAQFDTLGLKLIKIAAPIDEMTSHHATRARAHPSPRCLNAGARQRLVNFEPFPPTHKHPRPTLWMHFRKRSRTSRGRRNQKIAAESPRWPRQSAMGGA
jgi:hypothetical protein